MIRWLVFRIVTLLLWLRIIRKKQEDPNIPNFSLGDHIEVTHTFIGVQMVAHKFVYDQMDHHRRPMITKEELYMSGIVLQITRDETMEFLIHFFCRETNRVESLPSKFITLFSKGRKYIGNKKLSGATIEDFIGEKK